jgi:hypothetical protein
MTPSFFGWLSTERILAIASLFSAIAAFGSWLAAESMEATTTNVALHGKQVDALAGFLTENARLTDALGDVHQKIEQGTFNGQAAIAEQRDWEIARRKLAVVSPEVPTAALEDLSARYMFYEASLYSLDGVVIQLEAARKGGDQMSQVARAMEADLRKSSMTTLELSAKLINLSRALEDCSKQSLSIGRVLDDDIFRECATKYGYRYRSCPNPRCIHFCYTGQVTRFDILPPKDVVARVQEFLARLTAPAPNKALPGDPLGEKCE